jgi:hypothetical protein
MPGTQIINVPVGTAAPFAIGPMMSLCACPSVLGGTVLVETAPTSSGPWTAWPYGTISAAGSIRPVVTQWARATAATQAAAVVMTDMSGANSPGIEELSVCNAVMATPSSTAEQLVYSLRIPPNFLPANFRMDIRGAVTVTNGVGVKTLKIYVNGTGGTAMFTSPSLASNANYTFMTSIVGAGDGVTWKGFGAGASGGVGLSTTAFPTLSRDYIGQETEIAVTLTKGTGADTAQLDSFLISMY